MKHRLIIAILCFSNMAWAQLVPNLEDWTREPPEVTPITAAGIPSDAEYLFNGIDLRHWTTAQGDPPGWSVSDGTMAIVPGTGDISTKKSYGNVQLHVEWMIPTDEAGSGNSGIYLQGRYEVQIYNSYQNKAKIYYNGQAGSIYKQYPPLVNACLPPGTWESFDIVFFSPKFSEEGAVVEPARMTVFQNGLLIQHNVELKGTTTHLPETQYEPHKPKEPLLLQDHGDVVRFRNIWIREL